MTLHDQFAKSLLSEFLEPYGKAITNFEVSDEPRFADLYFEPNSDADPRELGLLGAMAQHPCLIEPFRNPVNRGSDSKLPAESSDGACPTTGPKITDRAVPMDLVPNCLDTHFRSIWCCGRSRDLSPGSRLESSYRGDSSVTTHPINALDPAFGSRRFSEASD